MSKQTFVVGDIHGCIDEFKELIEKIDYRRNRVVLVGDLIDRGPDPVGVVTLVRELGLESVIGNHEEKMLRWRRHNDIEKLTGKPNPMTEPTPERKKEWLKFSKEDLKWLGNLPLSIHLKDKWHVVHAGMETSLSFSEQNPERVIRIRYVDKKGKFAKPSSSKEKPEGCHFWAEKWTGPESIVFGHQRFEAPQVFGNKTNTCIGVDTSCCYGGYLTAFHLESANFVQIKAKKAYYQRPR